MGAGSPVETCGFLGAGSPPRTRLKSLKIRSKFYLVDYHQGSWISLLTVLSFEGPTFLGGQQERQCWVWTVIIEGSLEAKLPTIWTVETQSREEAERREKIRRKKR